MDRVDETLEALRRLGVETCRRMREDATRELVEPRLAEVRACFDAMDARVARGEAVPLEALGELLASLRAAEEELPFERRDSPQKYAPGAERVFRWSEIVTELAARLDELRYAALAAVNPRACDCLVLVTLGWNTQRPRSPTLRKIGGDAYACDECGTRWRHDTEDTESQHVEWWEPAKPPTRE